MYGKQPSEERAAALRVAATYSDALIHGYKGSYIASYGAFVIPGPPRARQTAPASAVRRAAQPARAPASAPVPKAAPAAAPITAARSPLLRLNAHSLNLLFAMAGQAFQQGAGAMHSTNVPLGSDEMNLAQGAIHEASHAAVAAHFGVASSISLEPHPIGAGACWPAQAMVGEQQRLFSLAGFVGQTIAQFGASRLSIGALESEFYRTRAYSPNSDWVQLGGHVSSYELQQCWQILAGRWSSVVTLAATHAKHAVEFG